MTEVEECFLARLEQVRRTHPDNRCARFLDRDLFVSLAPDLRARLLRCAWSGVEQPDSHVGCYLLRPDDLHDLRAFFDPLIHDQHSWCPALAGPASWCPALAGPASWCPALAGPGSDLDLATLGLPPVSLRLRVARNVEGFPMPGSMGRTERVRFEQQMLQALRPLIDRAEWGGRVYSLTPDLGAGRPNPNLIGRGEYQQLVDAGLMFRDMTADRYLRSAGLAADWPYGRACYVSRDRDVILWLGEEDHLRIISRGTGTRLADVSTRLRDVVARIEALPGISFARDPRVGYVTSCPSNLGTGLKASVQVPVSWLGADAGDVAEHCARHGLSVCGPGGDRTPVHDDGLLEVSPVRRAFVREDDILRTLFEGLRQISTVAVALVLLIAAAATPLQAQERIAIRSTGGFLGYLDGFPEFPGWVGDSFDGNPDLIPNPAPPPDPAKPVPYGGLIGVATYLKSHTVEGGPGRTVLLISGSNHPQQIAALGNPALRNAIQAVPPAATHWFWKPLIDLTPQAVGVGREDLQRWLAQMRPEYLLTWIRDGIGAGLPLVATNVHVRLTGAGVNVVRNDEHHLDLDVADEESLPMLESLTIRHACADRDAVRASAFRFDAGPDVAVKPVTAAEARAERDSEASRARRAVLGDICRTTLEFSERLRPGRTYLLASSLTGPVFRFRLVTHQVLTPHAAADGLPVAMAAPAGVPVAIMAFVSPAAAADLPPDYVEWTREQGCQAETCRIEFVAPEEAARQLLDVLPAATGRPAPMLVAISDLEERETTALLDAVPEIRFLSLPPESGRLGRAAEAVLPTPAQPRRYSGDQSFGAVIDPQQPELTRFLSRPTWLGEQVITASADVAPPARGGFWRVNNPVLASQPVPGASLRWATDANGIHYTASLDPARFRTVSAPVAADPAPFRPYCSVDPAAPFDAASGERQGDLWTNGASFTGLVLDDMRRSLGADVAIVPATWIDRDVIATIAEPPAGGVPPLSGFMLQRVLYRSSRVVRVAIEGSELGDVLGKIVKAAAAADAAVCISGLGQASRCPLETLDVDELLVNVRKPEDGHYYRIVLPAAMARAEDLSYDTRTTSELLAGLDDRLASCRPSPAAALRAAADPVGERLESRLAARPRHYVKVDPLAVELAATALNEPADSTGLLSKLPVDSAGEESSRRVAVDIEADAVMADWPGYAVRAPAELRYSKTRVNGSTAYDDDEFSLGVRVDKKRFPARWARVFAGVFWDGRVFERTEFVHSSGPTVPFITTPPRFLAGAYGLEVPEQTFGPVTVTGLQISQYHGRAANVPVAVRLGDERIELPEFLQGGAGDVLDARYHQDPASVSETTPFGYVTATHRQSRVQIDARTRWKVEQSLFRSVIVSTEHRYRWYQHDDQDVGVFTERSGRTKVSIDLGVGKRWSVGPYVERKDVTALVKGRAGGQHFSLVSWGVELKTPLFWNGRSVE